MKRVDIYHKDFLLYRHTKSASQKKKQNCPSLFILQPISVFFLKNFHARSSLLLFHLLKFKSIFFYWSTRNYCHRSQCIFSKECICQAKMIIAFEEYLLHDKSMHSIKFTANRQREKHYQRPLSRCEFKIHNF